MYARTVSAVEHSIYTVILLYVQLNDKVDGNKDAFARFTYHRSDTA